MSAIHLAEKHSSVVLDLTNEIFSRVGKFVEKKH
jgi:hypothetical protein